MNISILGCGWLGLPLGETLVSNGHILKGSTTTPGKLDTLRERNIEPYQIELNPELQCTECDSFWESEVLVLNIPPGRGRKDVISFHSNQVQSVIDRLVQSPVEFVVFASSTSVYPDIGGCVKERDAEPGKASRASGNALLNAEQMLMENDHFDTTVVRFGGLYGYDRHPVHFIAGKQGLERGNAPVNLIHRDDCLNILVQIIEERITGEILNAVSDGHPPKSVYYTNAAKMLGLEPPAFKDDGQHEYKAVSNRKLKETLDYRFTYPNPMDFSELDAPAAAERSA